MKKILCLVVVFSLLGVSSAFAFKMPQLSQLQQLSKSSGASENNGNVVIDKYVSAVDEFSKAQVASLEAFGLKTEAEQYLSEAKQFTKGNVNKNPEETINAIVKASQSAEKAVSDKMQSGAVLTEDGKKQYVKSLGHFAKGIVQEAAVGLEVAGAVQQTQGQITSLSSNPSGIMQLGDMKEKLNALLFLTKSIPSDLSQKKNILSNYAAYGRSKGIEVPADVTDAFK